MRGRFITVALSANLTRRFNGAFIKSHWPASSQRSASRPSRISLNPSSVNDKYTLDPVARGRRSPSQSANKDTIV